MICAQCLYRVGAWDEALVHAHTAIDLANDQAQTWVVGHVNAVAAWIHAGRGQWDLAERRLEQARAAAARVPIAGATILTRVAEAFLARAGGDAARVVDLLGPLTSEDGTSAPAASNLAYWPALIHALVDLGRVDDARRELAGMRAGAVARQLDLDAQSLTCVARIAAADGDAGAATVAFEAALLAIGEQTDLLEKVVLHHGFGRHLRAQGRRREAIVQLAAAHASAMSVGARPYLERIDIDLRRSERTPRPAKADPFGTLTARERDVITLIVGGASNREVAGALYISVKAVEYHVGNAYAKLHISSRRELKALVGSATS